MHPEAVLVEWADSRQPTNAWERLTDTAAREYCRCYSVGFVVQDDQDVIALAASVADLGEEAQATGVIVIPRVAVLNRTVLTSSSPASKQKRPPTSRP
jgi:hypothetical protein